MDYYGRTNYGYDNRRSTIDRYQHRSQRYHDQTPTDRRNPYRNNSNQYPQKGSGNPPASSSGTCSSKAMTYVWLGMMTFILLATIALGGVALHYSVFDTAMDYYTFNLTMTFVPFVAASQTVGSSGWVSIENTICKDNIKVGFGRELNECKLLNIVDDGGQANAYVGMSFYRNRVSRLSNDRTSSPLYIISIVAGSVHKLGNIPVATYQYPEVLISMTQTATLTNLQTMKNTTDFTKVESSMCKAIESKLGSKLYLNCYLGTADKTGNLLNLNILIHRSKLYSLLLEGTLKQPITIVKAQDLLKALLNTGTTKIDAFSNVLLTADAVMIAYLDVSTI